MSQSINEDKKYISEIRDSSGNEYKIINNRIEAPTYVSGTFYRPGDQVYKDDVLYTYVGYDSTNVYDNSFSYKFEKANFAKRSGTLKAVGKITYKTDNARYLKIYENISDGYYSYFDSSYFKKLKQGDLIVVRFQEDTVIPASTKVIEIINAQENGSYCFSADISWPGVSYHYKSKQDYIIPANEAAIFRLTSFGINNGKDQYTLNDCLYIGSTTDVHNYHDPSKQDKEEGKGLSTNDFTNEYKSKVDGAQIALSKESYKVLIDEFNAMEEAKGLLVGQNIYIQTIEVPDLWISSIEQTKQTYTYTTDQALINAIKLNGNQQIGFYKLSILETAKVDLSGYYTKTETDGKVDLKMNEANPVGTGSFSMNRDPNSVIGSYSAAEGYNTIASRSAAHAEGANTTASGDYSHAEGWTTTAKGIASHAEGRSTTAEGNYSHAEGDHTTISVTSHRSHVEGYYTTSGSNQHTEGIFNYEMTGPSYEWNNYLDSKVNYISGQLTYIASFRWNVNEKYIVTLRGVTSKNVVLAVPLKKDIDYTLSGDDKTITLKQSAIDKTSTWYQINYVAREPNTLASSCYYNVIGNGFYGYNSNAYALSCDGTGHYAGDIYVNCEKDSSGGKKLATEEYVDTHSISDIFLVKTVHDNDNNKYRADKTASEIYEAAKSGKKVIMQERPQSTDSEYAYFELVKVDKDNSNNYYIRFSNLKNVKTGDFSKIRYEFRYIDKEDGSTVLYTKEYTSVPNYPPFDGAKGRYLKVNENEDGFEWDKVVKIVPNSSSQLVIERNGIAETYEEKWFYAEPINKYNFFVKEVYKPNSNISYKYQSRDEYYIYGFDYNEEDCDIAQLKDETTVINGTMKIFNKEGTSEITDDSERLGSGMIIRIFDSSNTVVEEFRYILFGDVTGDANIDQLDVQKVISYIWNSDSYPLNNWQFRAADVNQSGSIELEDSRLIREEAQDQIFIDGSAGRFYLPKEYYKETKLCQSCTNTLMIERNGIVETSDEGYNGDIPFGVYSIIDYDPCKFYEPQNSGSKYYMYGLEQGSTVADLKASLYVRFGAFSVYANDGTTQLADSDIVRTGIKIISKRNGNIIETFTYIVFGDIGGNGYIEADDALLVESFLGGATLFTPAQFKAADLMQVGQITRIDATHIINTEQMSGTINQQSGKYIPNPEPEDIV